MDPFISVIVPVSRLDTFKNTLQALMSQTFSKEKLEIVAVTPLDSKYFKEIPNFRFNVIKTEKLYTPGKMRNIGAENASGDFYYFLDDDCIPPSEWIETINREIRKNDRIGAIGCRVVGVADTFWHRCADYSLFTEYQHKKKFFGPIGSAAVAVRKEAFTSVKGFDQNLLASEDWDFSLKLISKGWNCFFYPGTFVRHDHRRNGLCKIIHMGYLSGNRSGLIVQKIHKDKISIPASVLIRFQNPWLYLFISIPYAISLALFQITSLLKFDKKVIIYSPFMILSRIAYQVGVWIRLIQDLNKFAIRQ